MFVWVLQLYMHSVRLGKSARDFELLPLHFCKSRKCLVGCCVLKYPAFVDYVPIVFFFPSFLLLFFSFQLLVADAHTLRFGFFVTFLLLTFVAHSIMLNSNSVFNENL